MRWKKVLLEGNAAGLISAALFFLGTAVVGAGGPYAGCEPTPVTPNTPTGVAGCEAWGEGTASMYGPGNGAAHNACTWTRRHTVGCGSVRITAVDTGRSVVVPLVDFCDCYLGDGDASNDRLIDLQYGVVDALGLNRSRGLWHVVVTPVGSAPPVAPAPKAPKAPAPVSMPDTALSAP
jgi:rare lipoprotein A (peptidoglycan hydrolase)